jgi:ketosteroid isomerase-like protein
MGQLTLTRYYERLDAGDLEAALALMAPDVAFVIAIPGAVRRGTDRSGIGAYLGSRGDVVRRHALLRTSQDQDVEFVYGAVVDDEVRVTGHFLAVAQVSEGTIVAYHVTFEPDPILLPKAEVLP